MLPQISAVFVLVTYCSAIPAPYGYVPEASPQLVKVAVPAKTAYPVVVEKPQPYEFAYDIKDEYGNSQWRKEAGDEYGSKKGTYGYLDANGIRREVEYVAGPDGFRAWIKTNEPGTMTSNPADVQILSEEPPPVKPAVVVPKLLYKPAVVKPVQYPYGLPYAHPKVVYDQGLIAPKVTYQQVAPVALRPAAPVLYPHGAVVRKL